MDVTLDFETRGLNHNHKDFKNLFGGWLYPYGLIQDLEPPTLTSEDTLIGHNLMFDAQCGYVQGFKEELLKPKWYDTQVAVHLLREDMSGIAVHGSGSGYSLETLAKHLYRFPNYKHLVDFKKTEYWLDMPALKLYNRHDVVFSKQLKDTTEPLLKQKGLLPLFAMLMEFIKVLSQVQMGGVKFDEVELNRQGAIWQAKESKVLEALRNYSTIEWTSPKQVAEYFKAKDSTETTLKRLNRAEATLLLELREIQKQLHTYVEGAKSRLIDGIYYPSYALHHTVTGRLSEHLIQVLPRKDTSEFKRCIISKFDGGILLEIDWAQQEIRIIAEVSGDIRLQNELESGLDLHQETLTKFPVLPNRTKAKNINFLCLFGGGFWLLQHEYGLTEIEAKGILKNLLVERYPQVRQWHQDVEWVITKQMPIVNMVGRIRHTTSRTEAINYPIQSLATEFNKIMAIKLWSQLRHYQSHVILDCHDSLVVDIRPEEKPEVLPIIRQFYADFKTFFYDYFKKELKMSYPVDIKCGKNLYDLEKVE